MRNNLWVVAVCLAASSLFAQDKARVFVTDSKSWEISGHSGGSSSGFGGETHGGARPQTAEIIKTFGQRCPAAIVTMKQEKADYVVVLEHEGGKGLLRRDNKVAVFNKDGDAIFSRSTMSLGGSVEGACGALSKDWEQSGAEKASAANTGTAFTARTAPGTVAPELAKVQVSSTPSGADIEIDGSFMGSTPSAIKLTAGEHMLAVKKSGYKGWQRKIKVTGGDISLVAELEKGDSKGGQ